MFGNDDQNNNTQTDNQGSDLSAPVDDSHSLGSSSDDGGLVTPSSSLAPDNPISGSINPSNDDSNNNIDTPIGDETDLTSDDQSSDNNASDTSTSAPAISDSNSAADKDDLMSIKQDALTQLSPLVEHLDQSPEEKFRTTMMMIQASDNQSLVKSAFEAAKQITDDKARAQALLDIINEINYFTQQNN